MSLDANALVRAVKQAAWEAVQAGDPMGLCYGTVSAVSPLEITTDQKLVLPEKLLILTDNVRDFNVWMTTLPEFHLTEEASGGSGRECPNAQILPGGFTPWTPTYFFLKEKVGKKNFSGKSQRALRVVICRLFRSSIKIPRNTRMRVAAKVLFRFLFLLRKRKQGVTGDWSSVWGPGATPLVKPAHYGAELSCLIGKPKDYAMSESRRLITEALAQDDRITGLSGWTFEERRKTILARFVVHTIYGDVDAEKEVEI